MPLPNAVPLRKLPAGYEAHNVGNACARRRCATGLGYDDRWATSHFHYGTEPLWDARCRNNIADFC
jgi:hypothetical protein